MPTRQELVAGAALAAPWGPCVGQQHCVLAHEVLPLSLLTRQYGSAKSCPAGSVVQVEPL